MANRAHVPKFGDWNSEQPFTVVFDKARNKRQDLYDFKDNPESQPPVQAPTPPTAPRNPRPDPPKPIKSDTPRAPVVQPERNKVRAPPMMDQQYGGSGSGPSGGAGGLYGGYGSGGRSAERRQQQAPPPPPQSKPVRNTRGGNNGRGTTIPPFPGTVGSSGNESYTHIFEKVKQERRDGGRPYGDTANNTPSRPINNQHEYSPAASSEGCCFPWCRTKK